MIQKMLFSRLMAPLAVCCTLLGCTQLEETSSTPESEWEALKSEVERDSPDKWKPMLSYVASLHQESTHPACYPFKYDWEEIGPGYNFGPAFGHWDIVHQIIDVLPSCPTHGLHQLLNNIENQEPNGLVPGSIWLPGKVRDEVTWKTEHGHAPLWPIAANDYIELTGDKDAIKHFFTPLIKQITWFENQRKVEGEVGYYYSDIKSNIDVQAWESGIDEAVRYDDLDGVGLRSCIDASAHVCMMYDIAAKWADQLGVKSSKYKEQRDKIKKYIQEELYVEEEGLFHDIWAVEDESKRVLAVHNLFPLATNTATQEQADRLIDDYVLNEEVFNTTHPVATIAKCEEKYEKRMWRGPAWNSMTYWVARGCVDYGRYDAAKVLLEKALDCSAKQFDRTGKIWEFYDSLGGNPEDVQRKPQSRNMPCEDYLGHNPLVAMMRMYNDCLDHLK